MNKIDGMVVHMPSNEEGGVLRFGYVSVFDATKKLVRVRFPDKNNLVSGWLQLLCWNTRKNRDEINLDIEEHVACLMAGNGVECGVVLGALWDDKNLPPVADGDIRATTYSDGTTVWVDRKKHVVELKDHYGCFVHFEGKNIHVMDAHGSCAYLDEGNIKIKDSNGAYINMEDGNIKIADNRGSFLDMRDGDIEIKNSVGCSMRFRGKDVFLTSVGNVYINEGK